MISKEVRRLSRGLAWNGIFGNLGMAMAPLLAGLATWIWSPQAAFVVLGLMNLGGLMLVYRLYRPTGPPAHEHPTSGRSANLGAFAVLLIATTLCGIIYRGATATMPAYLELKNTALVAWVTSSGLSGMTPNLLATVSVSGIFLVGMFGQYLGGRMGERYDLRLCYLAFHSIPAACAVLIGFTSNLLLILCAAVYFFFLIGMQPIENTLVARYTSPRFHHSAYGTKFILTFGVGAFAIKLVQIIETGPGIVWVFPALGFISLLLTGVIGLLILTTRRNH
jgi:MFS family permease